MRKNEESTTTPEPTGDAANTTEAPSPDPSAPSPVMEGGKRLWLTYRGTANSIMDPTTGRTWVAGEEQEATEEEVARLQSTTRPDDWNLRRSYKDAPDNR